jgi:hypothetical protein
MSPSFQNDRCTASSVVLNFSLLLPPVPSEKRPYQFLSQVTDPQVFVNAI